MKPITPAVQSLLTTNNFLFADIFGFTLLSGATDYFTSLDIPVNVKGNTYRANGLRIEGLKLKLGVGLQVDEQQIVIAAMPGETLAGSNFITSVGAGLLDGAYILRSRAVWAPTSGIPNQDFQAPPVGYVDLCNMLVAEITKIGRTHVELTVKSPTRLLDFDMPRNYFSTACIHTLFDVGCTLVKSAFGVNGTVGTAPINSLNVAWNGGVPIVAGADALPYFAQGRLLFTSGTLKGQQLLISSNDANVLSVVYPLQQLPSFGDAFTAYPGCSKQLNTCNLKFANKLNFRGYPFVPSVAISV